MHKAAGARDVDGEPSASRVFIVLYKDFLRKFLKNFMFYCNLPVKGLNW